MPTITMMDIGGWLRSLGLERYEAAFQANAVDADVLRDLTDQDLQKLGVRLGYRRKLLRAIAALDGALAPASAPRPTPLPISLETILAAAAAGASPERQQGEDYSVSPSPPPSPMPSPERTTLWLAASDDSDGDNIQTAETGEAHGEHDYHDDPASHRWRYRLVMATAAIALAGLGVVSAFAYRAVSAGAVLPTLPPIMKAENAPNENIPNEGDNRPSDLSQTSIANAGSSEEFVSRFPADIQEPPKTGTISPDPSASPPSAFGSAVAALATTPPTPPSSVSPSATSVPPKVASPVPAPSSSTPKKIKTAISRSDGSGQTDTSAATAKSPAAKPSAAAAAPPVGMPLSLAPDAHDHSATSSPSRARMPAGTGTTAEASSGGGYEVAVASERSAADADAVFRSMQAKFPNQLGGREPIVRRTVLGPEGTYYRASIGPFVSMKAAARVCNSLKAAGEGCLVEKN